MAGSCEGYDSSVSQEIKEVMRKRIRANPEKYRRGARARTHLDQDDHVGGPDGADGTCACLLQDLDEALGHCKKGECHSNAAKQMTKNHDERDKV